MTSKWKHPLCEDCAYHDIGGGFIPPDEVNEIKEIMGWGEAGGADEEKEKKGFAGRSGRLLRIQLARQGYEVWKTDPLLNTFAANNVLLCRPPGNSFPGPQIARECMRRHQGRGLHLPWVAFGGNAVEALSGYKLKILDTRGSVLPVAGQDKYFTSAIHPAFALHGKGSQFQGMSNAIPLINLDVHRAVQAERPYIPVVHVAHPRVVLEAFQNSNPTLVSVDIEGKDGEPNIVGISWEHGEAWVVDWDEDARSLLDAIYRSGIPPVFHYGTYDIPELEAAGVYRPRQWIDTINLAALLDPGLRARLETQVLCWVNGTTTWKGLINHDEGPDSLKPHRNGDPAVYRALWGEILRREGRRVPKNGDEWYRFYNGLDAGWTLDLAFAQKEALESQGRMGYYTNIMQPLQGPLLDMGLKGMPCDPDRIAFHREACIRLERMAKTILDRHASAMLKGRAYLASTMVWSLEKERDQEHKVAGKRVKFSKAKELTSARTKLKTAEKALQKGLNIDSNPQRKALLYEWYGLPEVRRKRGKGKSTVTTDDDACNDLIKRLTKRDAEGNPAPTIKPKRGTREEVVAVLTAMIAGGKWATWRRNFLEPTLIPGKKTEVVASTHTMKIGTGTSIQHGAPKPMEIWVKRPRIATQYSQHRTDTGRLTSGTDPTEEEKKKKVAQLQNVPAKLRDVIVADPGKVLIGGDWSGIEWSVTMFDCATNVPASIYKYKQVEEGFHEKLLQRQQDGDFDPHRYLASFAFEMPEEQVSKQDRKTCKPYTHGRTYMGAPSTLARGAGHTDKTGEFVCRAHEIAFVVKPWQEFTTNLVGRKGFIETHARWRRYFWEMNPKPTEILATRIQGSAADLMKYVAVDIFATLPDEWEMLTTTHDSFLLQVPLEDEERAKLWLKQKMEQPIPFLGNRGWKADVESGPTWRDV